MGSPEIGPLDLAGGNGAQVRMPLERAYDRGASTEESASALDQEGWRKEVVTRLERYRARRKPRSPRYPSLLLPFDRPQSSPEDSLSSPPSREPHLSSSSDDDSSEGGMPLPDQSPLPSTALYPQDSAPSPAELNPPAKIIEFPRSAAIPPFSAQELAEPILDRPRIVEAPEALPLPPALGGILMEPPAIPAAQEKVALEDAPPQAAPRSRRLLAGTTDALFSVLALAALSAIFVWLNPGVRLNLILAAGVPLAGMLLWMGYQLLFLVFSGATPGMRLVHLRLIGFNGSPAHLRLRTWRVLASFLSVFAIGLGYVWSLLDENGLCWHDRITRTCIVGR